MPITIRKNQLKHRPGDSSDFKPSDQYKAGVKEYYAEYFTTDPITIQNVSIAVVIKETKKFFECELMDNNMVVPDTDCMFYVQIAYPWHLKDRSHDTDEILTDGTRFFIVSRTLAKTSFVLNDYSQKKLIEAVTEYAELF